MDRSDPHRENQPELIRPRFRPETVDPDQRIAEFPEGRAVPDRFDVARTARESDLTMTCAATTLYAKV